MVVRWGVVALAVLAIVGEARAQERGAEDDQARALYEAGRIAFDAGRFDQALEHFEQSYELSERPALLYNIGTTADRLRRNEDALEAFEAYLEAMPEASNRASVEARISVLRGVVERGEARTEPTEVVPPTPEETARAATPVQAPPPEDPEPAESGGVPGWVWAVVAIVVVGGAAATLGILLTRDDEPPPQSAFRTGDDGFVHMTLRGAP